MMRSVVLAGLLLLANIAPVTAECPPEVVAFRAHLGGEPQRGFAVEDYTAVRWTGGVDCGNHWIDGAWMPVMPWETPRWVTFGAQLWISQGVERVPAVYVAKVIKNGYPGQDVATGIGVLGTFERSAVMGLGSAGDLAMPGDTYRLWLFVTDAAAVLDGNPAHTWWSGVRH